MPSHRATSRADQTGGRPSGSSKRSWPDPVHRADPSESPGLACVEYRSRSLPGGHHAERRVRMVRVVVLAPVGGEHLRLLQAGEDLCFQQLVPQAGKVACAPSDPARARLTARMATSARRWDDRRWRLEGYLPMILRVKLPPPPVPSRHP